MRRHLTSHLACTALAASLATACGPSAEHVKTVDYLTELHPVLEENSLLAEQVLHQAAYVYNQEADADADAIAAAWSHDVLPMAQHVAVLAEEVQPPEHLATEHAELVGIWTKRAKAYREIIEGLHTADAARFEAASQEIARITVSEDQWVRALNARIGPMNLYVDLYP